MRQTMSMKANWIRNFVIGLSLLGLGSLGVSRPALAQSSGGSSDPMGGCCGSSQDGSQYCGKDTRWDGEKCVPKKK